MDEFDPPLPFRPRPDPEDLPPPTFGEEEPPSTPQVVTPYEWQVRHGHQAAPADDDPPPASARRVAPAAPRPWYGPDLSRLNWHAAAPVLFALAVCALAGVLLAMPWPPWPTSSSAEEGARPPEPVATLPAQLESATTPSPDYATPSWSTTARPTPTATPTTESTRPASREAGDHRGERADTPRRAEHQRPRRDPPPVAPDEQPAPRRAEPHPEADRPKPRRPAPRPTKRPPARPRQQQPPKATDPKQELIDAQCDKLFPPGKDAIRNRACKVYGPRLLGG